jgi:hypothetical protein
MGFWYDGLDPLNTGTIPDNNTPITKWVDKSGKGINATQTTGLDAPKYVSGGGLVFTAQSQLTIEKAPTINNGSWFFVLSPSASENAYVYLSDRNGQLIANWDDYSTFSLYGPNDEPFLRKYENGNQNDPLINLLSWTSVLGSDNIGYYNGAEIFNVMTDYNGIKITNLGGSEDNWYNGTIYEIISFNSVLSTEDRQMVEGYLASKWNIASSLRPEHPYYMPPPPPKYIGTSAIAFWYDGLDPLNTGITPKNDTPITKWVDKSGKGLNAIQTTGLDAPKYVSGGGLLFTAPSQLTIEAPPTISNGSWFFVLSPSSTKQSYLYWSDNNGELLVNWDMGAFALWNPNASAFLPADSSAPQINLLNWTAIQNNDNIGYYNGSQAFSEKTDFRYYYQYNGIKIHNLGGINDAWYNGTIYEIIAYDTVLSTFDRQKVEGYLANKWGIGTSLPPNHPYYPKPTPSAPISQIIQSNLALWYDGLDILNTGFVPGSNSAVSTWVDKSGNGHNAVSVATDPAFASGGGLVFSNSFLNIADPPIISNGTWFFVLSPSSSSNAYVYWSDNNGQLMANWSGMGVFAQWNPNSNAFLPTGSNAPQINLIDWTSVQGSDNIGYYNGSEVFNLAVDFKYYNQYNGIKISSIGASDKNGTNTYSGTIYEIIAYNTVLSTVDRQKIEGYLASKWNIASSLPSNHPYYSSPSYAPSSSTTNILNTFGILLETTSVSNALNILSTSIQSQPTSNSLVVTDPVIKDNINTHYSDINPNLDISLPLNIITTTLDNSGTQVVDTTKLSQGNSIISLDPGGSVIIKDTKITRGSLTNGDSTNQTNQITIDNINWLNYNESIIIDNIKFLFIGSGSPTLFEISILIPATSCANTYVCPGGGSGYGIQFNIVSVDIDTLIVPNIPPFSKDVHGLTVTAAANSDQANGKSLTSVPLTWWYNHYVLKYLGLAGPTPMSCIQPGPLGFAVGLAQTIVSAFGISPTRICNALLKPTYSGNDIDIAVVQFNFYITDIHPKSPLRNDYLPATCAGMWMMQWLARSTSVTVPEYATIPVPQTIPITLQNANCPGLTAGAPSPTLYFTSEINIDYDKLEFIERLKKSFGQSFAKKSFLTGIFINNNEHVSNVSDLVADNPNSIVDYFGMYSYPLSFIGILLFTIMNLTNKSLYQYIQDQKIINAINGIFVVWGLLAIISFLQVPVPKNIFNINSVVRYS